jgi:large subunit ribosomal protein L17
MLRNLATSLINSREDRIVTTMPKAKELRPFVERAITLSRRAASLEDGSDANGLHLRRQAASFFHSGNHAQAAAAGRRGTSGVAALQRLFGELGERFKDRPGGYTRIIRMGRRAGDGAELAMIELVDNSREKEAADEARKRTKGSGKKKDSKTTAGATDTKDTAGTEE